MWRREGGLATWGGGGKMGGNGGRGRSDEDETDKRPSTLSESDLELER